MERRTLGKTGENLSIIGFGGMVVKDESTKNSSRHVSRAIERGINYFDVAPEYGNAQEMLGPALKPYRKNVFLACKTHELTSKGAKKEFYDSLKKLKTDHFDLFQMHEVYSLKAVDHILGPGGALEFFIEAREKGLVRFLGFTTHSEEVAIALLDAYDFDSILFPINWALWLKDGFGPSIIEKALEKQVGILALKALARGSWHKDEKRNWNKCWYAPLDDPKEASLSLRFTLSLPVTAAVSPSHAELLWLACDIADDFKPISAEEKDTLERRSKDIDTLLHDPVFSIDYSS